MKNIFLIGFMGCGKSTVATCLSEKCGLDIAEMDQIIVEREGMPITTIFDQKGEEYFRNLETGLLEEFQSERNKVISCGGGVPLRKQNVEKMRQSGYIILLTARPETILERIKEDDSRPLLQGNKNKEFINTMLENRKEQYVSAADFIIETDGKSAEVICEEIMAKVK